MSIPENRPAGASASGDSPLDKPRGLAGVPSAGEILMRAHARYLARTAAENNPPDTPPKSSGPRSRLDHVAERFDGLVRRDRGYTALCPAHDDSNPSLSIDEGEDGRVLIHCFAGCPTSAILEIAGLRECDLFPDQPMVVATYDYRDEAGELLYQVVRTDPKSFRQRRPDGNGGWAWSVKDVRKVLYRLPELLAADPAEVVFVVEGEKDADRLAALSITATTSVGGAGKWRPEYAESLRGHPVVVLSDNDDPGHAHAEGVAGSLSGVAAGVKVVLLPGLPEKGDVSDWLDAGGTRDELLALAEAAADYDPTIQRDNASCGPVGWPPNETTDTQRDEPLSRWALGRAGSAAVLPFPVEVLPRPLREYVLSIAAAQSCPPDLPGAMMLPVLAAMIGRKRRVEVKDEWVEYPLLWVGCVARSGDGKTPAFRKVTEPLRRRQTKLRAAFLREQAEHKALPLKERGEADPPVMRQILTTDTTVEALKDLLATNPNGIIYPADELSGWARAMSQYKGGRGDDRQHWLSIWSGTQIVSNRRGADPVVIDDPFVCVTGGIQPDALGDLIDDGREDGFAARLLFAYPDPLPPAGWNENTPSGGEEYARVCDSLWNLKPSDAPVRFRPAAKVVWVTWYNAHHAETPPDGLRATWSKAEAYCLRLALVLHLARRACGETKSADIDESSIRGAVGLIEYFKSHARKVYGTAAERGDRGRIGNALRWVRKQGGTVTARLAGMNGLCKTPAEAKQLFHDLAELGHGTVAEEARGSVVFRLRDEAAQPDSATTGGDSCE